MKLCRVHNRVLCADTIRYEVGTGPGAGNTAYIQIAENIAKCEWIE